MEPKILISDPFKKSVIEIAKKLVLSNETKAIFKDEHQKEFDGMFVHIDNKPINTLFTFDFPEDFKEGLGKKIYVGND
jgi:hypothetical protein